MEIYRDNSHHNKERKDPNKPDYTEEQVFISSKQSKQ